jgi:hypothetical protein
MRNRFRAAVRAAAIHLLSSAIVAVLVGALVFGFWYPYPFGDFSGGRELFWLVISVDVIMGPLLTLFIFSPFKLKVELARDLAVVVCLQLAALGYGTWTVWQARPLFLVAEIDRFKVIGRPDVVAGSIEKLDQALTPSFFQGPITVAIRKPVNEKERQTVLFESLAGGRDYAERPEFYLPYQDSNAIKSLARARPVSVYLAKYPAQASEIQAISDRTGVPIEYLKYLPIVARESWIGILDSKGRLVGFAKGDGF